MVLNARMVETVKPDPFKRVEVMAGQVEGLLLRVTPNGVKTWLLRYRGPDGTRRKLTLGRYPAIPLADARKLALQALGKVASGEDPMEVKEARRKERMETGLDTVAGIATQYFSATAINKKPKTVEYEKWLLTKHILPRIGRARLAEIRRKDVVDFIRAVGEDAGPRTGNYAHAVLRQMLNFAIERELLESNPASTPRVYETKTRERVLRDDELKRFWETTELALTERTVAVSPATSMALRVCTLTLQRAGEVAGMTGAEIDWGDRAWVLPADRTKNGRTHVVPLSDQALEFLRASIRLAMFDFRMQGEERAGTAASRLKTTLRGEYGGPLGDVRQDIVESFKGPIFPSWVRMGESVERHTLSRGMSRVLKAARIENATAHDLRRTGASMMASPRCKVSTEVISRVLNHTPASAPVTLVYNRYDYAEEKRAALQIWADVLTDIVSGKPARR